MDGGAGTAGIEVRELGEESELRSGWNLGRLSFGYGPAEPPARFLEPARPALTRYGAFDGSGRMVGTCGDLHHDQWWHGRTLAAADIGGVAVLPEARGRGVARAMLSALLRGARARGAAVSALYPTVAAPYQSYGWERVGALRTLDVTTAELARPRPSPKLVTRPGSGADLPACVDLYERIARYRCGMLTRRGGRFPLPDGDDLPDGIDGLTLVEDGGELVGYASWRRGDGYRHGAVLEVHDALAATAEAATELVGVLASWHSVAQVLRVRPLDGEATALRLPLEAAAEHETMWWMLRPVDVVRAVADRGWPASARGAVEFVLADELAPWNAGAWRLELADGAGQLVPAIGPPGLHLSVRGFALLYAGTTRPHALQQAGQLRCEPGADPAALDLLAAGPPAQLLDYF